MAKISDSRIRESRGGWRPDFYCSIGADRCCIVPPNRRFRARGRAYVNLARGVIAMQLYNSFGPNPRAMRMFLAEKGITIPRKEVDLMKAENRKPPYTDRNPGGQLPALELDNGKCIGETVAIWEYLEEKHPNPPLIGSNAEERAEARMWQRRIELKITEFLYNGFRFAEGQQL